MPVAMVVDLLLADRASAVECPPIIDLFKMLRLVSGEAVWNFACNNNKTIKIDNAIKNNVLN